MNTIIKIASLLLFSLIYFSCKEGIDIKEFNDNFNEHTSVWIKKQITDSRKALIIKDPLDTTNNCLKIVLTPQDINAGAKRNEYVFRPRYKSSDIVEYSFKFMFTEDFFKKRTQKDWLMIHQWHDEPPKGVDWDEYDKKTIPPISLFIQFNPNGKSLINYTHGINTTFADNNENIIYNIELEPNVWYTFSNIVKWSFDTYNGYSIPKINDEYLITEEVHSEHKLVGENMYNERPNFYKMGLYGNSKSNDTISIFIDDFNFVLKENTQE